ncbi:MAG: hypothetical protein HY553_04705 [Elusimicrobia bacterium]|nr:hypothetical protein [Elusimicrobiota bacterium]
MARRPVNDEAQRVLRHLEHPGIETAGARPEGKTLAELASSGRRLEPSEALAALRSAADALAYLHAFRPPITHGAIDVEHVLLRPDGSAVLLDPRLTGSPAADVRSLVHAFAAAGELPPLWTRREAPADGAELAALLRDYRLPTPAERDEKPRRPLLAFARNAIAVVATLAISFGVTLKIRFEHYPEWKTKRDWAASLKFYQESGCSRTRRERPVPDPGELLANGSFEGPCGWRGKPVLPRHIGSSGSRSGSRHLVLGAKEWVSQDIPITGMTGGRTRLRLTGYMQGDDGGAEVVFLAAGGLESNAGGFGFNGSKRWQEVSIEFTLPPFAKSLRVYLDGDRSARWLGTTRFDDFRLSVVAP